ncbi:unnamed protein product [Arctogadus glacialis]
MELQGLQEALKVEIQCHQKLVAQMKPDPQDGELKKQLHDRHPRITSLSEKQFSGLGPAAPRFETRSNPTPIRTHSTPIPVYLSSLARLYTRVQNVLCFVVVAFRESALSLVVEASILWREGGGFFPNMDKKSAEFRAGGGMGPIHA